MKSKCTLALLVFTLAALAVSRWPGVQGGSPGFNCPISPEIPTLQPCNMDCTTQHGAYNGTCMDNWTCFCDGSGQNLSSQPCVYFQPQVTAYGLCHCADADYDDDVYDRACAFDCACNHGAPSATCNYETHQCICNYDDNTPNPYQECPFIPALLNATAYILEYFTLNP